MSILKVYQPQSKMTRQRLSDSQLNISRVEAFLKEYVRGFDSKTMWFSFLFSPICISNTSSLIFVSFLMSVAWKVLTRKIKFLLSYRQLSFFVHWAKFHALISPQLGRVCLSASVVVRITSFHKSMWCDDQLISPHLSWTRLKYVASSRCFIKALCLVLYLSVTPKHKEEITWQNRPLWLKSFWFPNTNHKKLSGEFSFWIFIVYAFARVDKDISKKLFPLRYYHVVFF